jgi:hypothetical protein
MKRVMKRKVSGSSSGRKRSTPKPSASSRSPGAVMPKLAPPSTLRVQSSVLKETRERSAQTRLSSPKRSESPRATLTPEWWMA